MLLGCQGTACSNTGLTYYPKSQDFHGGGPAPTGTGRAAPSGSHEACVIRRPSTERDLGCLPMLILLVLLGSAFAFRGGKKLLKSPYRDGLEYTGPFTQLTADFLLPVADPGNGFGPEDKLLVCNDALVFIDLDSGASQPLQYNYDVNSGVWSTQGIVNHTCPDAGQGGLLPRDSGYTVGQTAGPFGDRLLVLGGSPGANDEVRAFAPGLHSKAPSSPLLPALPLCTLCITVLSLRLL